MDFEFWPLMSAPARPRWRDHATRRLVQRARPTAAVRGVHRLIEIDMGDRCARLRMARRRCTPPGSMWLREIACGSFFTAALVPPYRRIDNSLRSVPTALYRYRVPARTHAPPAAKPSAAEPIGDGAVEKVVRQMDGFMKSAQAGARHAPPFARKREPSQVVPAATSGQTSTRPPRDTAARGFGSGRYLRR